MATTPASAFRYPDPSSTVDVARDIKNLATDVDTAGVMRFTSKAVRDSTLVGALAPKNGMMAYCDDLKRVEIYATMSATLGNWAGWTPLPGTLVAFVYRGATQPYANGTPAPIAFTAALVDLYSGWSSSTNPTRYTTKVPGMYLVGGLVSFAAGGTVGTSRQGYTQVNGVSVWSSLAAAASVPTYETSTPIPLHLSALKLNDYIELAAAQYSGVPLNSGGSGGPVLPALNLTYAGPG